MLMTPRPHRTKGPRIIHDCASMDYGNFKFLSHLAPESGGLWAVTSPRAQSHFQAVVCRLIETEQLPVSGSITIEFAFLLLSVLFLSILYSP